MSRPLRVGFVLHAMQVAGAEVLTREMIRRLGDRIRPTIFCLDSVGRIGEEMIREGHDLVCLDRQPGRDYRVSLRLAKAINERRIDVLHAHQYTPYFYAALAKARGPHRPRLILTEHGRHYPDRVSSLRRAVNRALLAPLADAMTACCRFAANGLCKVDGFPGSRIEIIENGIDVDQYDPAKSKVEAKTAAGLDPSKRYLIHVARHHPVKDQPTLLRGFAAASTELPDVDLLMVGDGPLRGDLEALTAELGISLRVKFLGIRTDIPALMRASDAFALTSLSEAASLTVIEAMATGLPSVLTHVGGNPELVRHEQEGLLFPRSDWAGCAVAIRRIFTDHTLAARCGAAARARAFERFCLDRTVDEYYALYQRLMGERTIS